MQSQLTILVPGIAGSKLYCTCNGADKPKRLYPRRMWFFNSAIDQHAYDCRNIETKPLKTFWNISVYEKFIDQMSSSVFNRVETFSYDWRRDPVEVAHDLFAFMRQCHLEQYTHVKLVGHSLGGLIVRIVIEYLNALAYLSIAPEQLTVYQCGTPMYGSRSISDYNYGFELAAILASMGYFYSSCPLRKVTRRDIKRIKPFLFSVADLRRIIETSANSMLYLLPTPMIDTLDEMLIDGRINVRNDNFHQVVSVHQRLAQLNFPVRYIFFFNISYHRIERVYLPFRPADIYTRISVHDIRPGGGKSTSCGIHLTRLLKSDGLVVPFSGQKVPRNCSVYVDESEKCHHARLMNSYELWRLASNSQQHFTNIHDARHNDDNVDSGGGGDDDDLPGYDDII